METILRHKSKNLILLKFKVPRILSLSYKGMYEFMWKERRKKGWYREFQPELNHENIIFIF